MITYITLILRAIQKLKNWYYQKEAESKLYRAKVNFNSDIKFYGKCHLVLLGYLSIGKEFICRSGINNCIQSGASKIYVAKNATLIIGDFSGISNVAINCFKRIEIGNHVNIGAGTIIFDTNFHSLDWKDRLDRSIDIANAKSSPVRIEDNVFIGTKCIICKGVLIGENSIVAAGSVVIKSIPSNEIWGGNPAKFIKKIDKNK